MKSRRQTRATAVTLTGALLGLGMLAGCTGGGPSAAQLSGTVSGSQAGSSATAPAVASMSASARLRAAQAALRAGGSVHIAATSSSPNDSLVVSQDATAGGGRQVITYDRVGRITVLFIAGLGYVRANALALQGFFGVPKPLALQFADQWIELWPGNKLGVRDYAAVTSGITLSSVAGGLATGGALTRTAPATVAGQRVVGVQEPPSASAWLPATAREVLYVSDNSLARPVLSEFVGVGSYKDQVSFSRWGEKLHLTAPANAVPASLITPASVNA